LHSGCVSSRQIWWVFLIWKNGSSGGSARRA
jgi:hypothetical protein